MKDILNILKRIDVTFLIIVGIVSFVCAFILESILKEWNVSRGIGVVLSFIIFIIGIVGEIKSVVQSKRYEEKYLNISNKVLDFLENLSGKVTISLNSLLNSYPNVNQKLHSPISVFVDTEIAKVLEDLSQEEITSGVKLLDLQDVPSGLVWIKRDADLSVYARVARYFDQAALRSNGGYIYSTNTILPSEFNTDPYGFIKFHIEEANRLCGLYRDNKMPRLLRLQLLHVENKPPESIINTKDEFVNDLNKLKQQNFKESNFAKYCKQGSFFVLNVDAQPVREKAPLPDKTFEAFPFFLGEYILYSNTVILKWDSSCNVLYLIFGKDAIKSYEEIFIHFWKCWKDKTDCNITDEIMKLIME